MFIWAARESLRRPGPNLLLAACLAGLTLAIALVLLVTDALEHSAVQLLNRGPDLVVRRVDAAGWRPVPVAASLKAIENIPGINQVRPRVWGLVQSRNINLTAVASDPTTTRNLMKNAGIASPRKGHAIAGGWWRSHGNDEILTLTGHRTMPFKVDAILPSAVDLAAYDTVLLNPVDAQRLLGIPEGWASDLALYVFHPGEAEALRPELQEIFPWPVSIRSRTEALDWYRSGFGRHSSLVTLLWLPAILALGLLVLAVTQRQSDACYPAGLLKALGWTTGDIVSLHLYQALIIGLPSITLGLTLAYALIGGPLTGGLAHLLLGWPDAAPTGTLAPGNSPLAFLAVSAFVLLPYLTAVLWPALKTAAADPEALIGKEL